MNSNTAYPKSIAKATVNISGQADLNREMRRINSLLKGKSITEDNWLSFESCLKTISHWLSDGQLPEKSNFVEHIKDMNEIIIQCLKAKRTKLVLAAFALLEDLAKHLKRKFSSDLHDAYFPAIIHIFSQYQSKSLIDKCLEIYKTIIQYSKLPRLFSKIKKELSSQLTLNNEHLRNSLAICLNSLIEVNDKKVIEKCNEQVIFSINILLKDKHLNVRTTSKSCIEQYKLKLPESTAFSALTKPPASNTRTPLCSSTSKVSTNSITNKPKTVNKPAINNLSYKVKAANPSVNRKTSLLSTPKAKRTSATIQSTDVNKSKPSSLTASEVKPTSNAAKITNVYSKAFSSTTPTFSTSTTKNTLIKTGKRLKNVNTFSKKDEAIVNVDTALKQESKTTTNSDVDSNLKQTNDTLLDGFDANIPTYTVITKEEVSSTCNEINDAPTQANIAINTETEAIVDAISNYGKIQHTVDQENIFFTTTKEAYTDMKAILNQASDASSNHNEITTDIVLMDVDTNKQVASTIADTATSVSCSNTFVDYEEEPCQSPAASNNNSLEINLNITKKPKDFFSNIRQKRKNKMELVIGSGSLGVNRDTARKPAIQRLGGLRRTLPSVSFKPKSVKPLPTRPPNIAKENQEAATSSSDTSAAPKKKRSAILMPTPSPTPSTSAPTTSTIATVADKNNKKRIRSVHFEEDLPARKKMNLSNPPNYPNARKPMTKNPTVKSRRATRSIPA